MDANWYTDNFPDTSVPCGKKTQKTSIADLTRFNKIAIQGTPQMAVDKEALICLSRVYSYYFKDRHYTRIFF